MKYKPAQMKQAIKDADHSLVQAAIAMGISHNLIVNFKLRGKEPKSEHLKNAMDNYIKKNLKRKGRAA